jgi:hypothetical protein
VNTKQILRSVVMLMTIGCLVGCGDGRAARIPVQGQVTMAGEPVERGIVRFVPVGDDDGPARRSPAIPIIDGQYRVQTDGGLQQGQFRVEVEIHDPSGKKKMVNTGFEMLESDELLVISSAEYAGADSPLTYLAEPGAETRFDIDVPAE